MINGLLTTISAILTRSPVRMPACLLRTVVGFVFFSLAAPASAQDRVRVALPTISSGNVFHFITQEKGFYREEKIEPNFEVTAPMIGVQATIAGDFHFTGSGTAAILTALKGAPIKLVFGQIPKVLWWLFAQPDMTSVKTLKGKTIGIEGPGTLSDVLTRDALLKNGLDPDRDVSFLGVGPVPNWYTSLKGKAVAAAIISDPELYIRAKEDGLKELFFYGDHVQGVLYNLATTDKFLRDRRDLAKRFLRASIKGLRVFLEDQSAAVQAIQKIHKITPERAIEVYRLTVPHYHPNADIDEKIIKSSVATAAQVLGVKTELPPPSRFYDFSITREVVTELQASGWKPQ
jgi:NitT/TauT family transport system substrate-binding protein